MQQVNEIPLPPMFTQRVLARLPMAKAPTVITESTVDRSQVIAVLASVGGLIGVCYLACAIILAVVGINHLPFIGTSSVSGIGGASLSLLAGVIVFVVHVLIAVFEVIVKMLWPLIGSTSLMLALCLAVGWVYILRNYRGTVVPGVPATNKMRNTVRR
jgi:hypothetical protein